MAPEEPRVRITREWLEKANQDLASVVRLAMAPAIASTVVFHCQQAAEKAMKAFLTWHDPPLRKTHELVELIVECRNRRWIFDCGRCCHFLDYLRLGVSIPRLSRTSRDQTEKAIRQAREVVNLVMERLPGVALS
jgi:HEPN domain-containing protein